MSENKVRFGVKKLYVGKYLVDSGGNVSLGGPLHIPGTTRITTDPVTEEMLFHADDVVYKGEHEDLGYEIEIENANFPDEFKLDYLGYVELDDGGVAQVADADRDQTYLMFESGGDRGGRRGILFNVSLGQLKRDYETVEKTKTPQTETLFGTVYGDDETGIVKVAYGPDSETYETLFTTPPTPADMAALPLATNEGELLTDDEGNVILGSVDLKDVVVYAGDDTDITQVVSSPLNTLGGKTEVLPGVVLKPQVQPLDAESLEPTGEETEGHTDEDTEYAETGGSEIEEGITEEETLEEEAQEEAAEETTEPKAAEEPAETESEVE